MKFYDQIDGIENPEKLAEAKKRFTMDRSMFLHQSGSHQPEALDPDNWAIDAYAFSIEADRLFMSRLLMNMKANFPHYPEWITYLKNGQPKTLILWGRDDPFFTSAAPEVLKDALPKAVIQYFEGGHFVLDEYADEVAKAIIRMFSL